MANISTVGKSLANVLSNYRVDGNTAVGVGLFTMGASIIVYSIANSGCELNLTLKDFKFEIKQPEFNVIDSDEV